MVALDPAERLFAVGNIGMAATARDLEYQAAMTLVVTCAQMLTQVDLADLLNAMARADALGPILDPTLYRDAHQKMDEHRKLIEAAMPLWRAGHSLRRAATP